MHQIKLIVVLTIFFMATIVSISVGQQKSIGNSQSSQEKIESQLTSIITSIDLISKRVDNTNAELNAKLTSEISSLKKQVDTTEENIASLSEEFGDNKKDVSNRLNAASSPDYTQIGMFWFSIILVLITIIATYINYKLYRLQTDPDVIVYSMPDPNRTTIINLIIENIGKGVAKNIQFASDRPIPSRAFGIGEDAPVPKPMTSGPLITGIPEMGPGSKRVITWGQYHGLFKGLGDEVLNITADYLARKTFLKVPRFKSTFSLDIKSFEGTNASDQNWDKKSAESLIKISQCIENITDYIKDKT
jgi:hypothetical protein